MASTTQQTVDFLTRFVRDVSAEPRPGSVVDARDFEGGVVDDVIELGALLNLVPGKRGVFVKNAIAANRYFIANWDELETGELGCCGVVLREKGR